MKVVTYILLFLDQRKKKKTSFAEELTNTSKKGIKAMRHE